MLARLRTAYLGKLKGFILFALTLFCQGCVEEFQPSTEFFESALVVESVITDEVKNQEIVLSSTFRFEEKDPQPEQGAIVRIVDNMQNEFAFNEVEPGRYLSVNAFGAMSGVEYTLAMETADGTTYTSDPVVFNANEVPYDVYPIETTNRDNVDGISLRVDSFDPTGNSQYYRFEFEETYKIIAPRWIFQNAEVVGNGFVVDVKKKEERVCYNTEVSNTFILANTTALAEDRLDGFELRFVERDNYIIAHRYSLLVRQYILSREAHAYYMSLSEISSSENLFSENQPGFIAGNINSENGTSKKVIGYFDVSSVASQRIFFDHKDFYPDDFPAAFPVDCTTFNQSFAGLVTGLRENNIKYILTEDPPVDESVPYQVVVRPCGDCTALGENVVPDFWEE